MATVASAALNMVDMPTLLPPRSQLKTINEAPPARTPAAATENKPATQKRAQHIRVHIVHSTTRTHRELVGFTDEEGSSPSTAPYAIAETLFFFLALLHILRFTSKRTLFACCRFSMVPGFLKTSGFQET